MGWWSTDIMGGDSPLDVKDVIFEICEVEEFDGNDGHIDLTKEDLVNNLEHILSYVRDQDNNSYYDERAIAFQVLGVLMMKAGAPISEELKAEILKNSKTDSWAQENEERAQVVNLFHQALEVYDGKHPIEIKSRGLFEVMAEHLNSGNKGLINKGKGL
jgi:hypothetical protein